MNDTPLHSTPEEVFPVQGGNTFEVYGTDPSFIASRQEGCEEKKGVLPRVIIKYMEELTRQDELSLAWDLARIEADKARNKARVAANERQKELLIQEERYLKKK